MTPAENIPWLDASKGPLSAEVRRLLRRVDRCCEANNWTLGYFGKRVAGDDTIIRRLRETGKVQARFLIVIEKFLDENPPAARQEGGE